MRTLVIALTHWDGRPFTPPTARKFNVAPDAALYTTLYADRSREGHYDDDGYPLNYAILTLLPWAIAQAENEARTKWEARDAS